MILDRRYKIINIEDLLKSFASHPVLLLFLGLLNLFGAVSYDDPVGIIQFPTFVTTTDDFDGTIMSIQTKSVFWLHVSINVPASTSASISLTGATTYMNIVQTHNGFNGLYSISRNGVMELQADTKLSFKSNYVSNNLRWISFRLDNCFSPLYAFRVARTSSLASAASASLITYDLVLLNIGSAWNAAANSFQAPMSGQYFFSL